MIETGPSFDRNSLGGLKTGRTLYSRDKMEINNFLAAREISINPTHTMG
jgi:hypothetical protein